jgi:hypothetical protein
MKGIKTVGAISYSILFILFFAFQAHAGWQLYDDFDSGTTIDESKWSIDNPSATISIESGELKFVHQSGHPNVSSWLAMIDRPRTITGIRATMRVENCTGDVRGRLGGIIGQVEENYVWSVARISALRGRIATYANLLDTSYDYIGDIFFSAFKHNWNTPFDITNQSHTIEWSFSTDALTVKTDAFGDIAYESDVPMTPTTDHFRGIGTRSSNGDGPCSVYFDDVYVYRQSTIVPQIMLLRD